MCLDKELWFKVYDRIYNERSENDKKRDQIIAFYTTLIGIMFAIFQKFSFSEIVEKFDIKLKIFLLFYIFIINHFHELKMNISIYFYGLRKFIVILT